MYPEDTQDPGILIDMEALRAALTDYYGTAMQQFPMVCVDLGQIDRMSDAELLREAEKLGWI